jgi:hypothetical protein
MGLGEENIRLRMRLNALKEQNDRLIGTVKVLEATNEQLTLKNESLEKLYKEFKDAFEDVFIRNVSDSWAKVDEDTKSKMKTQDKIYFFNREVNNTKIAIRDYLLEKIKVVEKEKDDIIANLEKKVAELEKEISARENRKYTRDEEPQAQDIESPSDAWVGKQKEDNEESPDNAKKREAQKKAFTTKGGSAFNFMRPNDFDKTAPPTDNFEPVNEEPKIHLEYTPVTFKEISSDKAITENKKYIPVIEKLDVMTKDEQVALLTPIVSKINEVIPQDKQPVIFNLLKIVGETGLFTTKDLEEEIQSRLNNERFAKEHAILERIIGKNPTVTLRNHLDLGCNAGLFEKLETPVAGGKGRPSIPYVISENGNWMYAQITKDDPVKSLYLSMAKEQKSSEHATNIKKVLDILEKNQYVCTQEDKIDLPDGRSSICDILAQKKGQQFRIEVEDGNYPRESYFEKYEKILRVGNWLIFISPNVETRDKIKMYFLDFLNERIYNGRDGFVQAGKKYIFLSIADLQNNPDIIYTSMMYEN